MIRELKAYELTCDGCKAVITDFVRYEHDVLSKHKWYQRYVQDCGLTGYTKVLHVCPKCVKEGDEPA